MSNSYTAALVDGTVVEIVDKVYDADRQYLVDAEGNRYVNSLHGSWITPVDVAEAVAEAQVEEPATEEETEEEVETPGAEELPEVQAESID